MGGQTKEEKTDAPFNTWCTLTLPPERGWPYVFSAGEHEAQSSGRRFCRRDSVWTAATCRRFCPPAQAQPPRIRPGV